VAVQVGPTYDGRFEWRPAPGGRDDGGHPGGV